MAVKRLRCNDSASLELALELGFGQLDADGAAVRAIFDIRAGQDLGHNGTICLLCFRCITIPPSRLRRATSLYTREALARCNDSASLELALELGFGQLDADGAAVRAIFDIRAGQDLGHNGTICLLCFRCITIPPSRLRRATSLV